MTKKDKIQTSLKNLGWELMTYLGLNMKRNHILNTYERRFRGREHDIFDYIKLVENLKSIRNIDVNVSSYSKKSKGCKKVFTLFYIENQIIGIISNSPKGIPEEVLNNYERFHEWYLNDLPFKYKEENSQD